MPRDLALPVHALKQGGLQSLGICPRHGRPAVTNRKQKFVSKTPSWVLLLLLVALIVAIIVSESMKKRAEGPVPACQTCLDDTKQFRLLTLIGYLASGGLLVVAIVAGTGAAFLLFVLVLLGAMFYSVSGYRHRQQAVVMEDSYWMVFKSVDTAFAVACEAAMAQAAPTAAVS